MNDEKKLPVRAQHNNAVQLHDGGLQAGSLIEQSITRLTDKQVQNLMTKAGDEALRLEVKNREQNMDYVVGKKAAEDHIDTFNMLEKGGKLTGQKVTSDIKTGAGNMRIESKSGATCFVASVAYGDTNHPDVIFLRGYRDNVLSKSKNGQSFITWYYRNGPKLAKLVGKSMTLRKTAKWTISKIIKILRRR